MEKYINLSQGISGKTFANMGMFSGLINGILGAVYSLILYQVFKSDILVGIYSSFFALVGLVFTLFSSELFRLFNKTQLTLFGFIIAIFATLGMSFPITMGSFISLDIARQLSVIIMGLSLSLFMVEFSSRENLARINGRYALLSNLGALAGPIIGSYYAQEYDNLFPLKIVSIIYVFYAFYFIHQHLRSEQKDVQPRKIVSVWLKIFKNIKRYIRRPDLIAIYMTAFGYHGIQKLRGLYVPLAIINAGYSKDFMGLVLALGTIPFIIFSPIVSNLSEKYGLKRFFLLGYLGFAICAFIASQSAGIFLIGLFLLWQIPNSFIEPILNIPFFKSLPKADYNRFFSIFKTAKGVSHIIVPMIAALFIYMFNSINGVWIFAGIMALITAHFANKLKN